MVSFLSVDSLAGDAAIPPVVLGADVKTSKKGKKKMTETAQAVELTAQEKAMQAAEEKAKAENAKRVTVTGEGENAKTVQNIGTRVRVGQTRGRNPQVISWEAFDLSIPESLPTTLAQFMEVTKTPSDVNGEKLMVSYLIDGYNDAQYTAASDPIAEFVNQAWSEEVQRQFRLVVRNYSQATGMSLEDSVALIKPGIEKSEAAKKAGSAPAAPSA